MKESEVVALGSFVLAGKEKLCLIRPKGEALALETLFVHEDVKAQDEIDDAVASAEVREPELALARQIIASLEAPFDPAALASEYRSSLRQLLTAKLEGQEWAEEVQPEEAEAPPADLMEALLASVSAAGKSGKGSPAKKQTPKTPAKKSPPKSSAQSKRTRASRT
jgi:DNA end-binding protein Ku